MTALGDMILSLEKDVRQEIRQCVEVRVGKEAWRSDVTVGRWILFEARISHPRENKGRLLVIVQGIMAVTPEKLDYFSYQVLSPYGELSADAEEAMELLREAAFRSKQTLRLLAKETVLELMSAGLPAQDIWESLDSAVVHSVMDS